MEASGGMKMAQIVFLSSWVTCANIQSDALALYGAVPPPAFFQSNCLMTFICNGQVLSRKYPFIRLHTFWCLYVGLLKFNYIFRVWVEDEEAS